MNYNFSKIGAVLGLCLVLTTGCKNDVNTWHNSHFSSEGYCVDSTRTTFTEAEPNSLGFYVEVSGSMNGFFRANRPTEFKKDLWSLVSNFGSNPVRVLTNGGDAIKIYDADEFRSHMNSGTFVSNKETLVPTMLETILSRLDYHNGACAVLVSDMKYSPELRRDRKVLLTQYQADIRNIIGAYDSLAVSVILAKSSYLSPKGEIVSENSPYYYVIFGLDSCVAFMRNRIATILEDNGNYIDCFETGFDYKSPKYSFGIPRNAIQLLKQPTFTGYETSDTCTIKLKLDLSDYRWTIINEKILRDCLEVKSDYGSSVKIGNIAIEVNNHYNKEFKRKAEATVELKFYNMIGDSDVIEWKLSQPERLISQYFTTVISAQEENDYEGSFSMDRFIGGLLNAAQNSWDEQPYYILISKN